MTDEGAIIALYRQTVDSLFARVCARAGGDRALTEDIIQETYLRAVRAWRRDGLPDNPEAWLFTVARNLLASHFRTLRRRGGPPCPIDSAEPSAGRNIHPSTPDDSNTETRAALNEGLEAVGAGRGRLLQAFHIEGRSTAEIAAREGISARAVEGRLRRARAALAALMRPRRDRFAGKGEDR